MAETLYIRLGSQTQDVIHWLIWSTEDNDIIASGQLPTAEQLTDLTEKAQHRQVITFVPSCDVALKALKVPAKSDRAMRLAAPYMLEDELAQDVDQLFFAYANHEPDEKTGNNCFIAAVDRQLMQQWLLWLADADIKCKIMIPDVLVMPLVEDGYSAVMLEQQIIIRQGLWQGLTLDLPAWQVISQQWGNITTEDEEQTEHSPIKIQSYSTLPEFTQGVEVQVMPEELPLALLVQQVKLQKFNLLQGEFQQKEQRSAAAVNWLWVAGFAVFALLLNLGIKGGQLLQLQAQQSAIETQIIQKYKDAFPETKKVKISTLKSQLKRKLATLGGDGQQEDFLAMLAKIQPAFVAVPQMKPESLKFDGKRQEIRLQAISSDYQYFEKFKNSLESNELKVNQGAQSNQGEQVSGSFSIANKKTGGRS